MYRIDATLCTRCAYCFKECPVKAVKLFDNTYVIDKELCIGCSVCYDVCPVSAVILND